MKKELNFPQLGMKTLVFVLGMSFYGGQRAADKNRKDKGKMGIQPAQMYAPTNAFVFGLKLRRSRNKQTLGIVF